MSWKSLICAGLLCVVASPALAVPSLTVSYAGNNMWDVLATANPANTAMAFELGFVATGGNILSIATNPVTPSNGSGTPTTPVEFINPGNVIFGWETLTDVDPGAGVNLKPQGAQVGTGADANEAFLAVGTNILATAGPHRIATLTTQPSVTQLAWGGIYNANGTLGTPGGALLTGLIAQENTSGAATNFYGFAGTAPKPGGFIAGDFDGNGSVGNSDLTLLLNNWGSAVPPVPAGWTGAQPTPPNIGNDELTPLLNTWGQTGGGGAALAASAAPEPTSLALLAMAVVALGVGRRRTR